MDRIISLLGLLVLFGIGYLVSSDRKKIRWRTVGGAFLIQVSIAAWVLGSSSGSRVLGWFTQRVNELIGAGNTGIQFVFGDLAVGSSLGFIFAFQVLPVIIFFSSLIAVLYHLGVMQLIVHVLGGGFQKLLGTTRAESLSAAANIFVGQTEAPLVVKPYLAGMTRSELFAVMVGGLASVAGSILAGYAGLGVRMDYLLAACFMAAPAGLLYAKLLIPETEGSHSRSIDSADDERPANVLDAAAVGAADGLRLALNVGAMLLAFIGLIAVLNLFLGEVGAWFGYASLSLQEILGWLFAPVAWLLGIPLAEIQQAGSFIGQKVVVNEFVAYSEFVKIQSDLTPRTRGIITFALCGFANLSSIAILLGGLGVMVPDRRQEIARLGLKAVLAATLANLTSAALAGLFLVN